MRERVSSGSPRTADIGSHEKVKNKLTAHQAGCNNNKISQTLLPVFFSRRHNTSDDDENDKQGRRWKRRKGTAWFNRLRISTLSRLLISSRGLRWIRKVLLLLVVVMMTVLTLEAIGRLRFNGYLIPLRGHNGQLGFYHEMNYNMQTIKDATGKPQRKLFPASGLNASEVKAWIAKRRNVTNGQKFLVGCSSQWKGYVLRSFLSLFQELKNEHGWKDLDTSKSSINKFLGIERNEVPSIMLFCLNSFYYPMELLQTYSSYFHELRKQGTILAVWNDDLHYYDQFNPIVLRDEIFTKIDVLIGTYAYFMGDYFSKVTESVDERDLPITVWLPHSSGPDFINASFNEYPINKIILSGKLGSNWYPLRHWLGLYQQNHRDVMDLYQHSGYYVADNQSAIYASYLRSYRAGITTTLIFNYVIAKIFEIPSTGALLVVNRNVRPLLAALGMNEGEHYVGFDRRDPESIIWWVSDPRNWIEIDRIRRAGMDFVRERHLVTNRVKALDLFITEGVAVYKTPSMLHLTSPCPSKALPDGHECQTRYDRESFYKCDRWFCGAQSLLPLWD